MDVLNDGSSRDNRYYDVLHALGMDDGFIDRITTALAIVLMLEQRAEGDPYQAEYPGLKYAANLVFADVIDAISHYVQQDGVSELIDILTNLDGDDKNKS